MKIIAFEGPDLSGKSSLIQTLSNVTGLPVAKKNLFKFDNEEEHHKFIDLKAEIEYNYFLAHKHLFTSFIADRFIVSNIVYARFYKRNYDYSYMKQEDLSDIDVRFIFVSLNDEKIIEQRLRQRGDFLDLNVTKIVGLREEYERVFKEFEFSHLKLDGAKRIDDNINLILDYIK